MVMTMALAISCSCYHYAGSIIWRITAWALLCGASVESVFGEHYSLEQLALSTQENTEDVVRAIGGFGMCFYVSLRLPNTYLGFTLAPKEAPYNI